VLIDALVPGGTGLAFTTVGGAALALVAVSIATLPTRPTAQK
jgi:hypothetical protein